MKIKRKESAPAASRFTRGERIGTKSGHSRRGAAGRRAERAANTGDVQAIADARVTPG